MTTKNLNKIIDFISGLKVQATPEEIEAVGFPLGGFTSELARERNPSLGNPIGQRL